MMKAAVFYGKEDLRIQELSIPEITNKNDVLIKVRACGICGTDMPAMLAGEFIASR